ncbi:REP-associated tyrosine transposase [Desulfonema magnum]
MIISWMKIHAYILMENHLHLIGSSPEFSDEIRKMKSFTARSIVDYLKANGPKFFLGQLSFFKKRHKDNQKYQVWQEGFHPKAILNEKTLVQKMEYVHHNPVRRGYVDSPAHWRYSSYRYYAGGECLVSIVPPV